MAGAVLFQELFTGARLPVSPVFSLTCVFADETNVECSRINGFLPWSRLIEDSQMRKKKKSISGKIFLLFIILAAGAVALSYYRSREVYTFWLRSYYIEYKKIPEKEMVRQAYELMKKKDYEALKEYAGIIILLYPDNNEARLMTGIAMLRTGETEKGLTEIVSVSGAVKLPGALVEESAEALFREKYFGEVISLLKGRRIANTATAYYLGISLYENKMYAAALAKLKDVMAMGKSDADVLYYCSLCSDKMGDTAGAMNYMTRAWEKGPRDRRLAERMVELYRRTGKIAEAEKILRKQKL